MNLIIDEQQRYSATIRFSQPGRMFRGLMIATMEADSGSGPIAVADAFQINYQESFEQARSRFQEWLEKNLSGAIAGWRL